MQSLFRFFKKDIQLEETFITTGLELGDTKIGYIHHKTFEYLEVRKFLF